MIVNAVSEREKGGRIKLRMRRKGGGGGDGSGGCLVAAFPTSVLHHPDSVS